MSLLRSNPVIKAASPAAPADVNARFELSQLSDLLSTVGKVRRPSEGEPKMSFGFVEMAAYSP